MERIAFRDYVGRYALGASSVLQVRMEAKDERRYRRLQQLANVKGGVRVVAEDAGLRWEALDQVLKKTPLPQKQDGTISPRSLGDASAEAIEDAYGLGRGWFDWPLDRVDHRRYWSLNDGERAIAEDRMSQEIDRLLALRSEENAAAFKRNLAPEPQPKTRTSKKSA